MAENKAGAKKSGGIRGWFRKVKQYFKDTASELKKVVWPSKKQTRSNTITVLVVVIVAALFMIILDFIFGGVIGLMIGA